MQPRSGQRHLILLAVLAALSLALGGWQAWAGRRGMISPPERIALAVVTPIQQGMSALGRLARQAADGLARGRELSAENQRLRARVAGLEQENGRLSEVRLENLRLQELLGRRQQWRLPALAARVVACQRGAAGESLLIDLGSKSGLRAGLPVMAVGGLVGQVVAVGPSSSRVLLLTDRSSGVGALVQRSRVAGVVMGRGGGCLLTCLPPGADVRQGDLVVSSGLGGIYPKGLPVGQVLQVAQDSTAEPVTARVRLLADLDRLEEVLVLREGAGNE